MSKRGAEDYITKDHGATPNGEAESKPKMATAAQVAKRKIAAPKSRLNRGNVGSASPSPNPFGGSAFGAPQPSQQTFGSIGGGVTFGQSQSFPPGGSTGSDFTFSVPGQSTSFTFGQSVANNPFANLNGGSVQDENKPPEDTLMESPNKKPAFGSGAFGAAPSSGTNGGIFAGFSGFGQTQNNTGASSSQVNGFGSGSPSLFQLPQTSSNSIAPMTQTSGFSGQFGSTQTATPASPPTNGLFGQSIQSEKTTPNFGLSSGEAPKPSFTFGQPSSQPAMTAPVKAPTFSFGQPSQSPAKVDTPKFSFGQTAGQQPSTATPASMVDAPQPASNPTKSLFAQSQSTPASNIFAGLGSSKPEVKSMETATEQSMTPAKVAGFSASSATPSVNSAPATNPFASLFAQTPKEASPAPTTEAPKSLFNFAAPAEPKGLSSSSATPRSTPAVQTGAELSAQSPFGFKATETPKTSTLSSASQAAPEEPSTPSLFSSNSLQNNSVLKKPEATPAKDPPAFSFGRSLTGTTPIAAESKPASGLIFGTPASAPPAAPSTPATSLKRPASNSEPLQEQPAYTPKFSASPANDQSRDKAASTPAAKNTPETPPVATTVSTTNPQRSVYTNPPARIPPYLSAEKYKSYDSNYRLHSLNREFQKRIASLDPTKEDFENFIRTYVAARESIGESIGLYTRNVAGMKRKEDRLEDDDAPPASTAKKAKIGTTSGTQNIPTNNQLGGPIFQPVAAGSQNNSASNANLNHSTGTPSSSSTPSLFKSLIPEKATSSSSSTGNSVNPFANLNAQTPSKAATSFKFGGPQSQPPVAKSTASKTTTPPSSPPKKVGFKPSGFSAPSSTDFMNAFKKQSDASSAKFAKETMEKRKAEDFDSDEEDEEAWMKKYEEEQRAKKAKLAGFRGFTPSFENSDASDDNTSSKKSKKTPQSPVNISSDEGSPEGDENEGDEVNGEAVNKEDEEEEDGDDEDEDEDSTNNQPLITNGKSIFDRISRAADAKQETSTPKPAFGSSSSNIFAQSHKATPETPSFSPITPSSTNPYKPATTFSFTPTPRESPTPTAGASVFNGGVTKGGPIPGEGMFGSRSSTPVDGESTNSNTFGGLATSQTTPGEDHTWKKGSAIKFGADAQAPAVNITAPSPVKGTPKFGALFGTGSTTAGGSSSSNSLGFSFGSATSAPAPGFLSATSHLAQGSGTTSGLSSRATSPGATDNESVATNDTDDAQSDPQSKLLAHSGPYPGEEDEDILFEARAKVFRNYKPEEVEGTKKTKGWNVEGLGPMRILKSKTTGKTRIVARSEPNANVVLNANLTSGVSYNASGSNVVVPVFGSGAPVQWMVKVKTSTIATELASILESNKPS